MLGADTKINLNPIERIIGEHDLDKLELGATGEEPVQPPIRVCGVPPGAVWVAGLGYLRFI